MSKLPRTHQVRDAGLAHAFARRSISRTEIRVDGVSRCRTRSERPGALESGDLRARVVEALKTCYDPEIPVDIYELGLIYGDRNGRPVGAASTSSMTLTSPACPVAGTLPGEVAGTR